MLARRVDQHAAHPAGQLIAQHAQRQRQIFVNDRPRLRLRGPRAHVMPELVEIDHVLAQALGRHALRRGTQDIAARGLGRQQSRDRRLQPLTLRLVIDARRHSNALAARHVHQIARRQRHKRRQARALGADRVFDDLHENVVAGIHEPADVLDLGLAERRQARERVIRAPVGFVCRQVRDVGRVQKRRALEPYVDERGLHAGQHSGHAPLVEIAHESTAARALDVDLLRDTALDNRGARFAGRHIDQYLDTQLTAQYGTPAARNSSAVSSNGSPITPE